MWFRLAVGTLGALGALLALLWIARPEREAMPVLHAQRTAERAHGGAGPRLETPIAEPLRSTPPPAAVPVGATAQTPDDDPPATAWPGTCSVHGELTRLDGQPPSGVRVRARDERGQVASAEVIADGARFRLTGLAPGRWWLVGGGHGYHDTELEFRLPHSEAGLRMDLALRPRTVLDVSVHTPSGEPFVDAGGDGLLWHRLLAVEFPQPPPDRHVPTAPQWSAFDAQRWEPWNPHLGRLSLLGQLPTHVALLLGREVVAAQWVDFGARGVDFVLDPGRLASVAAQLDFRVLDAAGRPADASTSLITDRMMTTGTVLDDGTCQFRGLTPEQVTLVVNAEHHRPLQRTLVLDAGSTSLGDLQLEPESRSRGRLVFPGGLPPDLGIRISLAIRYERVHPDGTREPNPSMRLGADADGSFLLSLDPGRYWLQAAVGEWMSHGVVVDLPLRESDEVQLKLQRRTHLVLRLAAGDWTGLHYRVLDDSGFASGQTGVFERRAPLRLALPPGPHRLVLTDDEGRVNLDRSLVLSADELVLDLAL